MFEGPDKRKKASGIPTAFDLTNSALRILGKGLGAAAKAGGNVLKNANDAQHRELAMAIIEPIMFVGNVRWISGTPRPPFKASLNTDELDRFIQECNKLTSRGIALDPYVRGFAAGRNIRLKN